MDRYSRQEMVIGKKAQHLLEKSTIAVVGIGALGTTAANLFVRAGVNVTLFDTDTIELHNLQRQTIFSEKDIGKPKALQAMQYLKQVNKEVSINAHCIRIAAENISVLQKYDVILDCTDSIETRFLLNDFCVKYKKPWIYSAVIGSKGMVYSYIPKKPCFRCIFSSRLLLETCEKCDMVGILNTISAAIASMQVTESLKILTHHFPCSEMIAFDIMDMQFQKIHVKIKKNCVCCQKKKFEFL